MIGKVTRGTDVGGLLRYLYGPGRANEHHDAHLVASWQGDDRAVLDPLEPAPGGAPGRRDVAALAGQLALPLQLVPGQGDRHVWQCSMRAADGDRRLSDAEWAAVARDVVGRTGFAPAGDPGGCRWVAVRHADDHVHVVVVLARQDGDPVTVFRDWPKVHEAARAAERRFGLQVVASPDRSARIPPSRAEVEKAARTGAREPARRWLTRQVRVAAAGSRSREQFAAALQRAGVAVSWRASVRTPGEVTGYAVGRPGDVDGEVRQVWFSGSKLAPDLSLPKLQARWAETGPGSARRDHDTRRGRGDEREAILRRSVDAVARAADGPVTPLAAVSAAEVATVVAWGIEGEDGGPLTEAAEQLADAARRPGGRRPSEAEQVHVLREVSTGLAGLGRLLPGEAGYVLEIVGDLTRIAHTLASDGTLSSVPGAVRSGRSLARYTGQPTPRDVAHVVDGLGPQLAAQVTSDPAWPALAARLRAVERGGTDPAAALRAVAGRRELGSAESVAAVLHHRLGTLASEHLDSRPAPGRPAHLQAAIRGRATHRGRPGPSSRYGWGRSG